MTPEQRAALESCAGRALEQHEADQAEAFLDPDNRNDVALADLCTQWRGERFEERRVTELGIRDLPISPRHRHALLQVLRESAQATPSWFDAAMEALSVPVEDRDGLADDLRAALQWLHPGAEGISVGAIGTRTMLKVIAQAVPAAEPACAALLALAKPASVHVPEVSKALNAAEGRIHMG